MTSVNSDANVIGHTTVQVKLSDGTFIEVQPLKMRQFFKLMKIVSRGAGHSLANLRLNPEDDQRSFATQLLTIVLFAIPEADDETIEFIFSMVKPSGLIENRELNKADKERNRELWAAVEKALYNPEPEDFVTIIETIVENEAKDIQALGKRLQALFKIAQKTGQVPENLTSPAQNSSEEQAAPLTSSQPHTDGQTVTYSGSLSDE